jgi:hypothetical protein
MNSEINPIFIRNTARLIHSYNWAIVYEFCEDAPAADQ